ncbi:amidohydrolase [Novosphingobium sp.]|uniref:amidohydrolase n=1 Tax=Novosphingobium sp. TaxID=1874826 RepID=UPI003D10A975
MIVRLLATAAAVMLPVAAIAAPAADTVLVGGQIHLLDAADRVVAALAIRDGRVIFAGDDAGAKALAGSQSKIIDLAGGVVMPGLIDGHMHPLEGGLGLLSCSLDYRRLTVPEIQAIVQGCLAKDPGAGDDKWLPVINWFQQETQPLGVVTTRALLDALPTKRPIYLFSSFGHSTLANSRALELAGITATTPDPVGGQIHRDAAGAATGLLEDVAQGLVTDKVPQPSDAENRAAARAALSNMARQGVTGFLDAKASPESIAAFSAVASEGGLTARAHFAPLIVPKDGPAPDAAIAEIVALRARYDQGALRPQPSITVHNVKLFLDGVITAPAQTGVMVQPYFINTGPANHPDWLPGPTRGPVPYFPPAVLVPLVQKIAALGFDPHMHADGDGAVRLGLDAVAALRAVHPEYDTRPALAHDEIVDPADYPRYKSLGVIPVLSFQWEKRAADTIAGARDQMGPDRFARLEPSGLLVNAAAPIAYGSDWPVDPLDEWFALKVGVTRRNDPAAGPDYVEPLPGPGLTIAQAVHAITTGAAYELREEAVAGSLEPGKFADLILIDRDIFHGDPTTIAATKVKLTMVGGKVVYAAAGKQ